MMTMIVAIQMVNGRSENLGPITVAAHASDDAILDAIQRTMGLTRGTTVERSSDGITVAGRHTFTLTRTS